MSIIRISDQLIQSESIAKLSKGIISFNEIFASASLVKDAKNNRSAYVSLDNLLNTVRPILAQVGLAVTQDLAGDYLATTILHESGEFKTSLMPFNPMDGKGINSLQALGGGITYAKRYALAAALLISVDTDDDGAKSGNMNARPKQKPLMTKEHKLWSKLVAKIQSGESTLEKTLTFYRINQEDQTFLNELKNSKDA
jgi:hypothetical protein